MTAPHADVGARISPPSQAVSEGAFAALAQAPPSALVAQQRPEESTMITEDELRRWTIDIVNGRRPTARAPEQRRVIERLVAEIEAIVAAGGGIDVPSDIPGTV